MTKFLLILLLSNNIFAADIPSVSSGQAIKADHFNEIVDKINSPNLVPEAIKIPGSSNSIKFGATFTRLGVISNNEGGVITSASCTNGTWTINLTGLASAPSRCFMTLIDPGTNYLEPRIISRTSSTILIHTVNQVAALTCAQAMDFECSAIKN